MRAMSLTAVDGGDEQQNEMRTFQAQLETTNKMITTLSRQLNELRDQVFHFILYFPYTKKCNMIRVVCLRWWNNVRTNIVEIC